MNNGCRGFSGGSSLARMLAEHRGVRNRKDLPPLTHEGILALADAYHARHGRWPHEKSGEIEDSGGETWGGINAALRDGLRGLPGGTTLFRLLVDSGRGPQPENASPAE